MASTTFQDANPATPIVASWLNDVNAHSYDEALVAHTAEHITYAVPVAGSVQQTVQQKLRESISVKDFGAVGDGVTDDTNSIQTALNSIAPGQTLVFAPGVYAYTNLILPNTSPVPISGADSGRNYAYSIEGNGATLKKVSAGSDASYGVASYNWVNNVTKSGTPIRINNLLFDGNGLATTAVLVLQNWNSEITGISVFGGAQDGLYIAGATKNGTAITSSQTNNRLKNLNVYGNSRYGIYMHSPTYAMNSDGSIKDVYAFDNKYENVYLELGGGWVLENIHTYNYSVPQSGDQCAYYSLLGGDNRFIGCEFDFDASNQATACVTFLNSTGVCTIVNSYFTTKAQLLGPGSSYCDYIISACQLAPISGTTPYFLIGSQRVRVHSSGTYYRSQNPFRCLYNNGLSYAASSMDFYYPYGIFLDGIHELKSGGASPYIGGYSYVPNVSYKYNAASSGGSYSMTIQDSLLQIISNELTADITIYLPPKSAISSFQAPFVFMRTAGATGAFNLLVKDVDTDSTIATISSAATMARIVFDGTRWVKNGSGSI